MITRRAALTTIAAFAVGAVRTKSEIPSGQFATQYIWHIKGGKIVKLTAAQKLPHLKSYIQINGVGTDSVNPLYEAQEDAQLEEIHPFFEDQLLATVWSGGSAKLLQIFLFQRNAIKQVFESRTVLFEWFYTKDLQVRFITSDTEGYPGDTKRWTAEIYRWAGTSFIKTRRVPFLKRFNRI